MDYRKRSRLNFPDTLGSLIPETTDLFMSGLQWLNVLAGSEKELRYPQWAELLREARGNAPALTMQKLEWLWEAITREPGIYSTFGTRLISLEEEWKRLGEIRCLSAGSRLGIFFKDLKSLGQPVLPLRLDLTPDAEAEILEPLFMHPGKARRLECSDVPSPASHSRQQSRRSRC